MNLYGVICEFNPFHLGHKRLIDEARKDGATHTVAVMSGNFTQRGEPSICEKHVRAEMAVRNGIDLVVELPLSFALAGAERFARGGVSLLNAFNTEKIFFGSECADSEKLFKVSKTLLSEEFKNKLCQKENETFASARERCVLEILGEEYKNILSLPNNILAVEYIKEIIRSNSEMKPFTVKRIKGEHDSKIKGAYSSSFVREAIYKGEDFSSSVPEDTLNLIRKDVENGKAPYSREKFSDILLSKFRMADKEELKTLPDISEGIENRLALSAKNAKNAEELYMGAKTKRYTLSRIRRLALCFLLGVKTPLEEYPLYIRVLAMNEKGKEILANISTQLPVITRGSDLKKLSEESRKMLLLEEKSTDIYSLLLEDPWECGMDITSGIRIIQ